MDHLRQSLKIEKLLTPLELQKANRYISTGGAQIGRDRALRICAHHDWNSLPMVGMERVLQHTAYEKSILVNKSGKFCVRIWTSASAPWLRDRSTRKPF